nr:MAG TPA: hypothetical protein [Bacteriophage sp.]
MFLLCQNGNKPLTFHFRPRHDVKRSFYYVKLN